jgi:exopolysaccharide biosynthesis polyprenyl glycosylphosphotransferase
MNKDLHKRIVDAKVKGLTVYEMPTFCEIVLGKIPVQHVSDLWFVYVPISGVRKTTYNQKVKKILDILLSMIVLTLLSPVILITAVAIKLDSPGPVFYVQRRIGWREQPFNLLKFRSMKVGTEKHREFAGRKNDPRITRVGKILRVSRFDEIPQLWNVIRGEMSFTGPRALMEEEVNEFTPQIPYFSLRHSIRPGITGWAQINYPHGATVQDGLAKLEYDLYYLKNLSPLLDLIILVRTVRTVMFGRGAR